MEQVSKEEDLEYTYRMISIGEAVLGALHLIMIFYPVPRILYARIWKSGALIIDVVASFIIITHNIIKFV